jgi:transcriptional regulator with GAF, ATPase, and Fis domain
MLLANPSADSGCAQILANLTRRRPAPAADQVEVDAWRIVGASTALKTVLADIECVAPTTTPVLIMGETGTGKDLLAHRIHQRSDRAAGPLIHIDCTTLTSSLMEAELFGHVRGAFTGASSDRSGRVKLADGGTLFLDEIGELPLEQQCKLLRLIQDREFEPVGSSRTVKVDVRIVAATNRDLHAEVANRRFRADLYYRLAGFPISLAPLRERLDDLPALVEFLLRRQMGQMNRSFQHPPASVMEVLQRHSWPGNIRELRSVIERACIRSMGRQLAAGDFDLLPATLAPPANDLPGSCGPRARTLQEVEREHLQAMLALSGGVIEGRNGAAALLGLSPSTLRFRIRRLGILADAFRLPRQGGAAAISTCTSLVRQNQGVHGGS